MEDIVLGYILGMDTFALGLLKAEELISDGRLDAFVKERYASFESEIGQKIRNGKATLKELADYACRLKAPAPPASGKQEWLETVVNSVLFG